MLLVSDIVIVKCDGPNARFFLGGLSGRNHGFKKTDAGIMPQEAKIWIQHILREVWATQSGNEYAQQA